MSPRFPSSPRPSSPAFVARSFLWRSARQTGRWPILFALLCVLALAEAAWQVAMWPRGTEGLRTTLVLLDSQHPSGAPEEQTHPIIGLMHDAEQRWLSQHARQSRTLEAAVAEYRRRYDRSPPAGFDAWFAWSQAHGVHFVDEYDRLEPSIAAFGGLSPARIRRELEALERDHPTIDEGTRRFGIKVEGGRCVGRGQEHWAQDIGTSRRSGWEFCEAIKDVVHLIPDTPEFIYSTDDLGLTTLSFEQLQHLRERSKSGDRAPIDFEHAPFMNESLLPRSRETGYFATALACPPDSPARRSREDLMSGQIVWDDSTSHYALPDAVGGFIHDAAKAQDPCFNAEMRKVAAPFLQFSQVSSVTNPTGRPRTTMEPRFSQSKLPTQIDWLIPQLYEYPTMHDRLPDDHSPPPWDERQTKVVWRGQLTGVFYPGSHTIGGEWEEAQRMRLHRQCNDAIGWEDYVYATAPSNGSVLRRGTSLRRHLLDWYDVGLTSHPDCGYDACAAIHRLFEGPRAPYQWKPFETHYERFKFILDIDGFGWSGRFRDLLRTGSVVMKATAFPEFFSDYLQPWYHYVPFNLDASDLPSLMAFFAGSPTSATHAGAHDALARAIGERGREFAALYWRTEDVQANLWRVLLEYRRVWAEEPGSMDYVG